MSARKRIPGISRRTLLKAGAFMSAYPAPQLLAQTPEPLKIGFLTVLTGPLAAGGQQQQEGAALFRDDRNGMIAGRKVELITQDTGGNPALAKTKTQELVERHKVPVMIGPLATNEALAMDGYIRDTKVPKISLMVTRELAASISHSRRRAARSCRNSGRRSTHPNTRPILRRSNPTLTPSIWDLPAVIRCAFLSSSPILG